MSTTPAPVILYGLDASQPCRFISWILRTKQVPFQYVHTQPNSTKGAKSPEFLEKKNRAGLVPVLEHGKNIITESASIGVYLAEVFQWDDLYPLGKDRAAERAKINTWLHWTHKNSRDFTYGIFAPYLTKIDSAYRNQLKASAVRVAKFLNEEFKTNKFLGGFNQPTLADYAVFADIGQCTKEDLDIFDFTPYPNLSAWISRMKALPYYKETHAAAYAMLRPIFDKAKEKEASKAKL